MVARKTEIRRYRRTHAWDYARGASLFITIATRPRRKLFGRVEGDRIVLSPLGAIVEGALEALGRLNPGVTVFGRVVMPDHVHFNVHLAVGLDEPLDSPWLDASEYWKGVGNVALVGDDLCANPQARFIRILPSSIPNARYKPESRYVKPFAQNRYLEIAKGNEDVEFNRAACLDYNAEIVEIAKPSSGLALYWKATGLWRL